MFSSHVPWIDLSHSLCSINWQVESFLHTCKSETDAKNHVRKDKNCVQKEEEEGFNILKSVSPDNFITINEFLSRA